MGRTSSNKKKKGRSPGVPNLKRSKNGKLINMHGVEFTPEEKRQYVNAVRRANYRREQMLKQEAKLPRMVRGKPTGDTVGSLQLMGKESDFILAKRTASLQRFETRKDFQKAVNALKRINSPNYIEKRVQQYKRNYIKALQNELGNESKDIQNKIRRMNRDEFMKMIQGNEDLEIWFIYTDTEAAVRREELRANLGMKSKEETYQDI